MLTRRSVLLAAGALPLAGSLPGAARVAAPEAAASSAVTLPDKAEFPFTGTTYLDSGSFHPIGRGAHAALAGYLARRSLEPQAPEGVDDEEVLAKFARLVNADKDEVAFVQSTTTGEQMVLRALGIPESGGHIVTDTMHFFGSFPLYEELARRGMQVTWVRPRDNRIVPEDIDKAIRPGTKLVALSAVSTFNGFQHDLKAVCELAHSRGALVYADSIHAVGCVPFDLHASGVDFAACASYKWLMGDFGLGFIYARKELLTKLKRSNYGYYGMREFKPHVYPLDPPGEAIADYAFADNATGAFALGTHGEMVMAQLDYSLDYLQRVGVANIQAHAQTLTARLKKELPELGYPLLTPTDSTTPLVTCLMPDARKRLGPRLKEAKLRLTTTTNRFRVSVSVFNDVHDIDRLLTVLGHA